MYRRLFEEIYQDESRCEVIDPPPPAFGDSLSDYAATVEPFYRYWLSFVSVRRFASADKWDTREAPDRRVKRLMEKDNAKLRETCRREYIQTIRVRLSRGGRGAAGGLVVGHDWMHAWLEAHT